MPKSLLPCLAAAALLAASTADAEQVTNGNFEAFSGGIPVGWTYSRGTGDGSNLESTTVSPFSSAYGSSTRSALLTDGSGTGSTPELRNFFPAISGNISLSFDFRLGGTTLPGDPWVVLPRGVSGLTAFNLFLDYGSGFRVTDGFAQNTITPLAPSTWYHVQINASTPASIYNGSITPFGGAPINWGNKAFINPLADIRGLSIFDDSTAAIANAPLYLDNFSVTTAVPEPTAWSLLALALPIILVSLGCRKALRLQV